MPSEIQIFVSSTGDLAEEREAIRKELEGPFRLYLYEDDAPAGIAPIEQLTDALDESRVLVSILGPRYGSTLNGDGNPPSVVEWEFDEAVKRDLPILPYRKCDPDAPGVHAHQRVFMERVMNTLTGKWSPTYSSPPDLVRRIRGALDALLARVFLRVGRMQQEGAARGLGLLRQRFGLVLIGLAACVALLAAFDVIRMVSAVVCCVILVFLVLVLRFILAAEPRAPA